MKKAILGVAAAGALVSLVPPAIRMSRKMREHSAEMAACCKRMAGQCRQMGARDAPRREAVGSV